MRTLKKSTIAAIILISALLTTGCGVSIIEGGAKIPTWDTLDPNAATNDNIWTALALLNKMPPEKLKDRAVLVDPGLAIDSPQKYYKQPLMFSGEVTDILDYPAGSHAANVLNKGSECSEIRLIPNNADFKISYLYLGSANDIKEGDKITVYGFIIGLAITPDSQNLAVVGSVYEKQSPKYAVPARPTSI